MPKEKLIYDFELIVDGKSVCKLSKTTSKLPRDWKDLEHRKGVEIIKSFRRFE